MTRNQFLAIAAPLFLLVCFLALRVKRDRKFRKLAKRVNWRPGDRA